MTILKRVNALTLAATLGFSVTAQAGDLVIAGRDGGYGNAMQYAVDKFTSENPDVNIELLKLPGGDLYAKASIALREKSAAYDIVMLDDTWATEFMSNGWLIELPALDDGFIPAVADISEYPVGSGKAYSVPFVGNVVMFGYRKDLFEKHGLATPPATWSDVVAAAKTIQEQEGIAGVVFRGKKGNPIVTGFLPIFWAHGASITQDGKAMLNSDAGVAALELYLSLKEYAPTGVETYNSGEVKDAMQQGKAAIAIEVWPGWVSDIDNSEKSKVVGQVEFTGSPKQATDRAAMLGIWQLAIPVDAKNKDDAMKFLDFISSEALQTELNQNVGHHPTRTAVYQKPEVLEDYRWYAGQLNALENGVPRPRTPLWSKIEATLGDYLQLALIGQMDAKAALDEANAVVQKILDN